MNNKEKRQYIDCLALLGENCYLNEIAKLNQVLRRCPNTLFKYRAFDKFTYEMIESGYVYLSPAKDLDDPFDCVSDFDLNGLYNKRKDVVGGKLINYILKKFKYNLTNEQIYDLKHKFNECMVQGGYDLEKLTAEIRKNGLSEDKAREVALQIVNCQNVFDAYERANTFDQLAEVAYNSSYRVGVCSLSEIRDNKVMWSLYGDKYKGYCIEYEIPFSKEARGSLFPVLYSKRISNNFTERMFDTIFAEANRNMPNKQLSLDPQIENVGAINELFCLKDTDWKYQREWRIVSKAGGHFPYLKIKSIYLGFKVDKSNENKMKRNAKKYGFSLFKMNPPNGKKKISYTKIY